MKVRSVERPLAALVGLFLATASCEKVSLVAPSGSSIILTAQATALPANGTTDIIGQVLEAAGTPPHSGTVITFTTTLGSIEPAEARTDTGGRVIVKFRAGTNNGTAIINATSGGATTVRSDGSGAVRIALGTASVGRVSVSANPNPVSANGGTTTITANVADINGNALSSAPVTFTTTAGSLADSLVNTGADGAARTTLVTSVQATVTATVGVQGAGGATGGTGGTGGGSSGTASGSTQVNVNPLPTVGITVQGGNLIANAPIAFTITAQPGTNSTAQIRNVKVDFGDGDKVDLGAVSGTNIGVQHRYDEDDTYIVRVTVVDSFGTEVSSAITIVVQPEPPLGVTVTFVKAGSTVPVTVTFTATVSPASATVSSYVWDFGDGKSQTTTSNQAVNSYTNNSFPSPPGPGAYIVKVLVTTNTGKQAVGQTAISIP